MTFDPISMDKSSDFCLENDDGSDCSLSSPVGFPRNDIPGLHQGSQIGSWLEGAGRAALLASFYVVLARVSLFFAFEGTNACPMWPPSGIALAAVLTIGPRIWPGILVGAVLANVWGFFENLYPRRSVSAILLASIIIGIGNTGEALLGGKILKWWLGRGQTPNYTIDSSFKFLFICPAAVLFSSVVGTVTLCTWGLTHWPGFLTIFVTWWLGDLSGILTVTPAVLGWYYTSTIQRPSGSRFLDQIEYCVLLGMLIVISAVIFGGIIPSHHVVSLPYLVMPLIIWAAFRFNRRGLPLAVLVVAVIAVWGACRRVGPFQRAILNESLLQVQLFVSVLSILGMLLAAVVREHHEAARALSCLNSTLEERVEARTAELQATNEALQFSNEAAQAASLAKSHFLANISHEIRTPIHAILAMTDLALDTSHLAPDVHEQLETVLQSAGHLLEIVDDILDISAMQAGELKLVAEPLSMRQVTNNTMSKLLPRAKMKGLELIWSVDDDVPDALLGDQARLCQCIVNLVGNAIKFTSSGSVQLSVSLADKGKGRTSLTVQGPPQLLPATHSEAGEEPADQDELPLSTVDQDPENKTDGERLMQEEEGSQRWTLLFTVRDTGIGIAASKQGVIFRSFEQVDMSMTRIHGGTGLGLTITSSLVDMLGGKIWFDSTPSQGSNFYFTACLPAAPPHSSLAAASAIVPVEPQATPSEQPEAQPRLAGVAPLENRINLAHGIPQQLEVALESPRSSALHFPEDEILPDCSESEWDKNFPTVRSLMLTADTSTRLRGGRCSSETESRSSIEVPGGVIVGRWQPCQTLLTPGSPESKVAGPCCLQRVDQGGSRGRPSSTYSDNNEMMKLTDDKVTKKGSFSLVGLARQLSSIARCHGRQASDICQTEQQQQVSCSRAHALDPSVECHQSSFNFRPGPATCPDQQLPSAVPSEHTVGSNKNLNSNPNSKNKSISHKADTSITSYPRAPALSIQGVSRAAGIGTPLRPLSELRFLVADDSKVNCKVAQGSLAKYGILSDCVTDGAQALNCLSASPDLYALLLLDVQMPVMDGLATARAIRERERLLDLPRLPIIALTAYASTSNREECLLAGMDGFVSKPFKAGQLLAAIQALLQTPDSEPFVQALKPAQSC